MNKRDREFEERWRQSKLEASLDEGFARWIESTYDLPELVGTYKQDLWARRIRADHVWAIHCWIAEHEERAARLPPFRDALAKRADAGAALDEARRIKSASHWIDARDRLPSFPYRVLRPRPALNP